ncbi:MAG TPA: DUF1501 domain-containing protein [Thermoanaerobaculia bacterium]|jgi:uncharacterized protein (DUF1501 family)|nr:DUF1501 domain-containing protein [Thermoanaerobaculia bacterium]
MTPFTRRNFLRSAGLGSLTLPAWFPRVAFAATPSPQRDVLICIFQRGAADGLNMVVPVGDDDYYKNRPTIRIAQPSGAAGAAIDLDGFFALHPSLAPFKELWDDGVLAAVQATGSPDSTHSHFDAMDFMERGTPGSKSIPTGWIGRHLGSVSTGNASPFRVVGMGTLVQASLRGPVAATALQSIADFHLGGKGAQASQIATFQAGLSSLYADSAWLDLQAQQTVNAINTLAAANPGAYQPQNGAKYPDTDFGSAMMQVAQLIKADLGMEVACVDLGGWDTHASQGGATGQQASLLAELAGGLAAFHADLADRMSRIIVVTMSEFGRRLLENGSGGTDHGHGNCMFVLGGGVNGGKVYADWPGLAPEQLASPGDLAITTDYRTILAEIVDRRLLNSRLGDVFPGFTPPAYLGLTRAA